MMTIGHRIQLQLLNPVHHLRCPPKNSPGSKSKLRKPSKTEKTTRPDEKPSTAISLEPDTRGSVFGSTRPQYNLRPRKRQDIPNASSSQLPQGSPPEGHSPELELEDNESLYATNGGSPRRSRSPSADPLNIGKLLINAMQIDTPSTYKQALRSPLKSKWQEATRDEFNSLTEMGTWILVSPPKNRNVIKCKWVFMIKADGHYKAQVVAKGFTQEHGIDYEETFSPVTRYESIRYLLAHAALEDWEIEAMDVKTVYLYGKLKEEIYMAQPEGFIKSGQEHKVCKLVKSIYRLKQAGRVWYETISKTLQKKLGFQQLHSDAGVHVHCQREGDHEIILILYVDDLLIMGNSQPMIYSIKKQLMAAYQMKDLGAAISYLGIRITRDRKKRSIWIEQEDYIHNALTRFNLLNANDTKTPLPEGVRLVATTEPTPPEKLTQYQQLIGTFLYASIGTCPDIAFAVTRLSRYNTNPTDEHHRYMLNIS